MPRQSHAKTTEKKSSPSNTRVSKMPKRSYGKAAAEEDKHDARDARLAIKEAGTEGGISWKKLKNELGI